MIEASAEQFNLSGAQRSIYQKVDRTLVEKKEIDYGISWTTHDAFGLLLQVWVSAYFSLSLIVFNQKNSMSYDL